LFSPNFKFAAESSSGLGAFNVNLKGFIFQLLTFVIILLALRKWVVPKLVATLESRRQTLEQSLVDAKETKETLAKAEERAEAILTKARAQADKSLAEAKQASRGIVNEAEAAAEKRANLIIDEARAQLNEERQKLRSELRGELANLVADATEKIVQQKIDQRHDTPLIERAIRSLSR
jgi:F-type H+-transporting ATPase subunit b